MAVFRCVEPCRTYKMRGNYQTKMLEPRLEWGKCLHWYFYVQHPRLGLLHLRLQTWFPFLIHICLNGLRPETTIHAAEDLMVYRTPETRPDAPMAWYPLRRGVADLYRRAEISRAANERYLTALAAASLTTPLAQEAAKVCQPVRRDQRRHRALNPFAATDAHLLAAVNRGEWALKGFRNRQIRALLFGQPKDKKQQRSQAAKVSRRLALLHAHGLIAKVSKTHRWQVTQKGRRILTALLAARQADTDKLIALAA